jgi:hypothetical protein
VSNFFTLEEIQHLLSLAETFDIRDYVYRDDQGRQQIDFEQLSAFKPCRLKSFTVLPDYQIVALTFRNGQVIEFDGNEWIFKSDGVYLIRAENGLTKIGHSSNIEKRLLDLQIASPVPLKLLHYWLIADASNVESALHQRFAAKRKHGEWFDLDDEDITAIVDEYSRT